MAGDFTQVTKHNREHVGDRLSCEPIRLKLRSSMGSNEMFGDLRGIITTKTVYGKDNRESIKKDHPGRNAGTQYQIADSN